MTINPPCNTRDAPEETGRAADRVWSELMLKGILPERFPSTTEHARSIKPDVKDNSPAVFLKSLTFGNINPAAGE
jgi:hypothetical protein